MTFDALGLSPSHISPRPGEISIYPKGQLITIKRPITHEIPHKGGGRRGKAKFSRASRRRLMRKYAITEKKEVPIMLTLTYPKEWNSDPEVWKKHLDNFAKRLFRKFPNSGFAWKLESQKRGAPHYHLLVWGIKFSYLYVFASKNWFEVVGSGDEKHFRAGTRVERIRSSNGAMSYCAKYMGKIEGSWIEGVGRYWGFRGCIPWADVVRLEVNNPVAVQMIRYLRRYIHAKSRSFIALTGIVSDPMRWAYLYQYEFDRLGKEII